MVSTPSEGDTVGYDPSGKITKVWCGDRFVTVNAACAGCKKLSGAVGDKCCENDCGRCKTICAKRERGINGEHDINVKCTCRNCECGCCYELCNCCDWCPRSFCKGAGTCTGFVLNKPGEDKCPKDQKCKGHGVCDSTGKIYKHEDRKCTGHTGTPYKCYFGDSFDKHGNCIMKCKDCGTTCFQGLYYRVGYAVVPLLPVLVGFFIFWAMFPEKFHAMMAKIRATFANSSESSRATTKSLVGKRIPEEMNNEKYPALRPRAYAGLSSA